MRIVKQLLLGALAFSRFTVAQDEYSDEYDEHDEDNEEYPVHGNDAATYNSSMQVREGNYTVHFVNVGSPVIWNFYPNSIQAAPGDKVMFTFFSANHSIIQAAFGFPCVPYNMINPGSPTFYSGFHSFQNSDSPPVWNLTINDTNPIFYYCGQLGSCNYFGMVGGINLDETTPISNQIGIARKADFLKIPGAEEPTERQLASIQRLAASSTVAPFTVTETPESTDYPYGYGPPGDNGDDDSQDEHHGLSTGATAGIAVGSAVVAVVAVGLIWLLLRTRSLKKKLNEQRAAQNQSAPMSPMGYGQPGSWPGHQSQHMSQLPPYNYAAAVDMNKPPDSEGYHISDLPSRGVSPPHQISPYNMQGQFVGFQSNDLRQNTYTTQSELDTGTIGLRELDAPK